MQVHCLFLFITSILLTLSHCALLQINEKSDFLRKSFLSILGPKNNSLHSTSIAKFTPLSEIGPEDLNFDTRFFSLPGMPDIIPKILEYLHYKDLHEISLTSTTFFNAANFAYLARISKIIPNFPHDRRLTLLLVRFFTENGLENGFTHDSLELITYKFGVKKLNSALSNNVNWHIISFFQEIIHGPRGIFPLSHWEWRQSFVGKLQNGYNLDKTFDEFERAALELVGTDEDVNAKLRYCLDMLRTFSDRPSNFSIEDANTHVDLFLLNDNPRELMPEIYFGLFIWNIPNMTTTHQWSIAINFMLDSWAFSQTFWDAVSSFDDLLFPQFEIRNCRPNSPWNRELVKKFLGPSVNGLNYLLTRNSSNTFDLQELLSMNVDMRVLIREFLYCAGSSMIEIEIFSQIVKAGLFPVHLTYYLNSPTMHHFKLVLESN